MRTPAVIFLGVAMSLLLIVFGIPPTLEILLWCGSWLVWSVLLFDQVVRKEIRLLGGYLSVACIAGMSWGFLVGLMPARLAEHNPWYGDLPIQLTPLEWLAAAQIMGVISALLTGLPFVIVLAFVCFRAMRVR